MQSKLSDLFYLRHLLSELLLTFTNFYQTLLHFVDIYQNHSNLICLTISKIKLLESLLDSRYNSVTHVINDDLQLLYLTSKQQIFKEE